MPNNFDYFLSFIRNKIDEGVKQVDIATSSEVQKSTAWVNKLYKGNPKGCPVATQRSVADYFGISYEEMIETGKLIYEKANPPVKDSGVGNSLYVSKFAKPEELINLLNQVISGIKVNHGLCAIAEEKARKHDELLEEIALYKTIFSKLNEGVTFFNSKRDIIFSSDRWGFLDGIDPATNPSFDTVVLGLLKKIVNFDEVLDVVSLASKEKRELEVDVETQNGAVFHFRIIPIFQGEMFLGSLLINTLKSPPKS
jgi:PAS domain-containing protein